MMCYLAQIMRDHDSLIGEMSSFHFIPDRGIQLEQLLFGQFVQLLGEKVCVFDSCNAK